MFKQKQVQPHLKLIWELQQIACNPKRTAILRREAREHQHLDPLAYKRELKALIEICQQNGQLAVYHWGRDCDQYESDGATTIPATVMAYERWEARIHDNAEGPTRTEIMSFDEYRSFTSTQRDHRAEQYNY